MASGDIDSVLGEPKSTNKELAAVCQRKVDSLCQLMATQQASPEIMGELWSLSTMETKQQIVELLMQSFQVRQANER